MFGARGHSPRGVNHVISVRICALCIICVLIVLLVLLLLFPRSWGVASLRLEAFLLARVPNKWYQSLRLARRATSALGFNGGRPGGWRISRGAMVIARGKHKGSLFVVHGKTRSLL